MKHIAIVFLFLVQFANAQSVQQFTILPKLSIRALEVVDDKTVWFAANRGVWGFTEDGGKSWHIDSMKVDTSYLHFRSIQVLTDSIVFLMNINSPAYIYKSTNKGKTWKQVYKDAYSSAFYDCLLFHTRRRGIALGDPIYGYATVALTEDAGENWDRKGFNKVISTEFGESFFAASNSNIDVINNEMWVVTGGKRARVFHFDAEKVVMESFDTPLPQGETMTGIYSIDMFDPKLGAIAGGNYDKTDIKITSMAITTTGGKKWKKIKTTTPFFGSCVRFKNANEVFVTGHDGTFSYNLSTETLSEIKDGNNTLKFYTLRFSPKGKTCWLAGSDGRIACISF